MEGLISRLMFAVALSIYLSLIPGYLCFIVTR
jgi:hypothetical protein